MDRPTQKQRAKYAMIGVNKTLDDADLKPIHDLSENIRDSYTDLNRLTHLRNYTNDLQALAETYIDKVQIYLLKLLELREIYFTE